ncbi:MAG: hypothetical protein AAB955_00640 [Patescibacteria group bacterium]
MIGFIGQGFIGKNYADDFEERGHAVVRYSRTRFPETKDRIAKCGTVFIAVPTPTTPLGFDLSSVRSALTLVGEGHTAVIKSTMQVGSTELLQKEFPNIVVMHSPEFLREKYAAEDARHPERNIVGIVDESVRGKAEEVIKLLPKAPYEAVVSARTAELIKYAGNTLLTTKVIFMNLLYDLATAEGVKWDELREALIHDSRIGTSHADPVHESGHGGPSGRGAGGHCFIKDFAAFRDMYQSAVPGDLPGLTVLRALEQKNIDLLRSSGKDLDLLNQVYGV